jgi:hypothetical protein
MTSPALFEPWYPGRPFNLFGPTVDEADNRIAKFKRKLEMNEEPPFDMTFKNTEIRKVSAMSLDAGNTLEFDFQAWKDSIRIPPKKLFMRVSFLNPDGHTKLGDTYDELGAQHAFLRDNFLNNYIKTIELLVNGQPIRQEHYDHISRIVKMMTQPEGRDHHDGLRTDWGIPFDAPLDVKAGRGTALNNSIPKTMTPNTLPSTYEKDDKADRVAISEQAAYNERYCKKLLGSEEHIFGMDILHPMMSQEYKNIPFATPFQLRVILNDPRNCFTCSKENVPFIKIHEAWIEDKLIRCDSKYVNDKTNQIIRDRNMKFPVIRRELSYKNIISSSHVEMNRVIIGTVPSRIYVFVAPSDAFLADDPRKNPYVYRFPGYTKFAVKYGTKMWPREEHVEFKKVPKDMFENKRIRALNPDEIKTLAEANTDVYDILRGPFSSEGFLHKMAVKEEDWFRYSHVMCVDFTPLGCDFLTPDLRGPIPVGDISFDIHFAGVMPDNYKLVTICEWKNIVTWNVPDFGISWDV